MALDEVFYTSSPLAFLPSPFVTDLTDAVPLQSIAPRPRGSRVERIPIDSLSLGGTSGMKESNPRVVGYRIRFLASFKRFFIFLKNKATPFNREAWNWMRYGRIDLLLSSSLLSTTLLMLLLSLKTNKNSFSEAQ